MKKVESSREKEIIADLQRKKEQAVLWLLEDYGDTIKSVIAYHMRGFPEEEREECLNQVLFAVWENCAEFREEKGSFGAWVAGIAKNKALGMVRGLWKFKQEQSLESLECKGISPMADGRRLEQVMPSCEFLEDIPGEETWSRLSCLKQKDRALLWEYYQGEYSVEEMAVRHGAKPAAIYKRLERAKKKLRKQDS